MSKLRFHETYGGNLARVEGGFYRIVPVRRSFYLPKFSNGKEWCWEGRPGTFEEARDAAEIHNAQRVGVIAAGEVDERIRFGYVNWRGVAAIREVTPVSIWFGTTEFHPEPQWLMKALDHEKNALRDFALDQCDFLTGKQAGTA